MTPVKAIRAKCLDCCCGSFIEVKMCTCVNCSLYPFRLGKNPNCKPRKKSIGGESETENIGSYPTTYDE